MASNSKKNEVTEADGFILNTPFADAGPELMALRNDPDDAPMMSGSGSPDDPYASAEGEDYDLGSAQQVRLVNQRLSAKNQQLERELIELKNQTKDGFQAMAAALVKRLNATTPDDQSRQPTDALKNRLAVLLDSYPKTWV